VSSRVNSLIAPAGPHRRRIHWPARREYAPAIEFAGDPLGRDAISADHSTTGSTCAACRSALVFTGIPQRCPDAEPRGRRGIRLKSSLLQRNEKASRRPAHFFSGSGVTGLHRDNAPLRPGALVDVALRVASWHGRERLHVAEASAAVILRAIP